MPPFIAEVVLINIQIQLEMKLNYTAAYKTSSQVIMHNKYQTT